MKAPTREDFFRIGAAEVISRSNARPVHQRISRSAIFTEGTDINLLLAAASAMADEAMRFNAQSIAALYYGSAVGDELDRLVADRTSRNVPRKRAAAAKVTLTFSRSVPGVADLSFLPGRKFRAGGQEFELSQSVSMQASFVGTVSGEAVASLTGTRGNVDAGLVSAFVVPSEDPNISVTNPEPAAGGSEKETDEAYSYRAGLWWLAQMRGTAEAIEFGALTVPGVKSAVLTEMTDSFGYPNGFLLLTIADANGRANRSLIDAVSVTLRSWRGAGVPVGIVGGTPRYEQVEYSVGFAAGTNSSDAAEQLKILTVSAVNALSPGAPLTRALLLSVARSVFGVIVSDDSVRVPVGTLVPLSSEVIRTNLSLVRVNGL